MTIQLVQDWTSHVWRAPFVFIHCKYLLFQKIDSFFSFWEQTINMWHFCPCNSFKDTKSCGREKISMILNDSRKKCHPSQEGWMELASSAKLWHEKDKNWRDVNYSLVCGWSLYFTTLRITTPPQKKMVFPLANMYVIVDHQHLSATNH